MRCRSWRTRAWSAAFVFALIVAFTTARVGVWAQDDGTTPSPVVELLTRRYEWNTRTSPSRPLDARQSTVTDDQRAGYEARFWERISTARLEGFQTDGTPVREARSSGCGEGRSPDARSPRLRSEGGMCQVSYWLEILRGDSWVAIDSAAALQRQFAPVDSAAKAVSFVAVLTPDLVLASADTPAGHVLAVEDGFLVEVLRKNTFGCGSHAPTGRIYKVMPSGDVTIVAVEPPPATSPEGPLLCVD